MTGEVDEYIERFDGEKKEWLIAMVRFMRDNFPELEERLFYGIPAFRFDGQHVAFSVAKDHFTFHTLDFDMVEELRELLPMAGFGKGSVKIRFADRDAMPVLFDAIRKIIKRWKERGPPGQPRASKKDSL